MPTPHVASNLHAPALPRAARQEGTIKTTIATTVLDVLPLLVLHQQQCSNEHHPMGPADHAIMRRLNWCLPNARAQQ